MGRNMRFPAARAEAALVEVARKRRRERAEGLVDMAEGFHTNWNVASKGAEFHRADKVR